MTAGDKFRPRAARHVALPQIGTAGQERIESSTALLIGLGGIGCAVASYLASSGVGQLLLCDFDTIDETNLGRQFLYGPADVGRLKTSVAAARLSATNPDIQITELPDRLGADALLAAVDRADVVLDGCDNFATRFQVNDACVQAGRTLVSGAAIRFEGQIAVFGPDYRETPCYRCLYREADESLDNCAGHGVLAPVPGVVGTQMAVAALRFLAGMPIGKHALILYDGLADEWREVRINKRADCESCSG